MLIDVKQYISSLKKLWSDTFGDDEEYVRLFFDCEYCPAECFAEIKDGEVVSALYLLKGYILSGKAVYEGRYLYAAATAESQRGKGIMSSLIREAQKYAESSGISFISLLPADEGLYGYYERFGFEAVMNNIVSSVDVLGENNGREEIDSEEYFQIRRKLSVPFFHFGENELRYASECLKYAGYRFIKNSNNSCYIINDDETEVLEYISTEDNISDNNQSFIYSIPYEAIVTSPYDLSDYCECKENRFGMVYFVDAEMKSKINGSIYMNIALD